MITTGAPAGGRARSPSRPLASLRAQTAAMGIGTGLSRVTGLLRILALAWALGIHRLADAYNLANNAPNMLYDVVLGGVLSATFIPVFIDRLVSRSEREAWRAISAVCTLSLVLLVLASAICWVLSPEIIGAFFALSNSHTSVSHALSTHERTVATSLLRWFVPQIALYGVISLSTALLNVRGRFVAPMWTAIANNVVCILVLVWFHVVAGGSPNVLSVQLHPGQLVLLGLGTTLGVAVQALLLLPSLRRAGLHLGWHWEPGHEAVRAIGRLGSWTLGFVLANQVAQFIVLSLAVRVGSGAVSAYMYAYTFLQVPYAIVAVSIMSAVTPTLAERWTLRDTEAFRRRLSTGLRAVMSAIVPAALGMLLLARPGAALLFQHGASADAVRAIDAIGAALAMFALGLPGFCAFQYVVRVLQSMKRTRVAFWLYVLENVVNVVLAVAFLHPLGVRGLALALSLAYSVAAVVGLVVLRRWLGPLGSPRTWAPLRRVLGASAAMAVVVLVVSNLSGATSGWALVVRVGGAVVAGGVTFVAVASLLGASAARRDHLSSRRHPDKSWRIR